MNGKTHVATGVASVVVTTFVVSNLETESIFAAPVELIITNWSHLGEAVIPAVSILLIGIIGGQLPDIDQPTSTIANSGRAMGKMFAQKGFFGFLLKALFWIINFIPQTIAWVANTFLDGHRGVVHSFLALFVVSGVAGFLSYTAIGTVFYGLLVGVAYLTHLLVDSFTKSGVGYLQPFSQKEFRLLPKVTCWKSSSPFWNGLMQGISWGLVIWLLWLMLIDRIVRDEQVTLLVSGGAIIVGALEFLGAWYAEAKKQQHRQVYSH